MCGLAALAGCPRFAAWSSRPDRVLVVAANGEEGTIIWRANVTNRPQVVRLARHPAAITMLDERSFGPPPDCQPTWVR